MDPQPYAPQYTIPSKPSDVDQDMIKPTFKEMLTTSNPMFFTTTDNQSNINFPSIGSEELIVDHTSLTHNRGIKFISLTEEERQRIYEPWKNSIIVKLVGKRMLHHYLKKKIQELWRPTEDFQLIDLGEAYYIIKFKRKENMDKAIQQGPWFINGHFLSITRWKPNFVATKEKVTNSAVWVRLPQLPTKFYDEKILEKIGNAIGRLLKIDVCTSTTLRGRYARLCVELPLEIPVQPFLYAGHHKQVIHYEGENFLCKNYGRLGPIAKQCTYIIHTIKENEEPNMEQPTTTKAEEIQEEWKTVSFSKGKQQGARGNQKHLNANPIKKSNGPRISVKLFNTNTGKYLDTQLLQYKSKDHKNASPSLHTQNSESTATMIGDHTNLATKNNFSLLTEEPMILEETTKREKIQKDNMKNCHAIEQMSIINKDIDMLDTNVSSSISPTNHITKVAMQDYHLNDHTTSINNYKETVKTNPTNKQIGNKPTITQTLKQNLSSRSDHPTSPKHAIQMAKGKEKTGQVAANLEHAKDMKNQPINLNLGDSNDIQKSSFNHCSINQSLPYIP
ncbi:PREDICTED: uncharacterized protein LOC109235974 [Nicotiana attenuata]|uniref:uncharacterized protein LOC109235974 n=1 Tax=Nicotiana attenuata TaxID=49451 RepID=UPI000905AE88|nr:PREDICTED: uncharacterized protein LOC109235974 [Nicotiana attenuata]